MRPSAAGTAGTMSTRTPPASAALVAATARIRADFGRGLLRQVLEVLRRDGATAGPQHDRAADLRVLDVLAVDTATRSATILDARDVRDRGGEARQGAPGDVPALAAAGQVVPNAHPGTLGGHGAVGPEATVIEANAGAKAQLPGPDSRA